MVLKPMAVVSDARVMTMYLGTLASHARYPAHMRWKCEPNSARFRLRGEVWVETETVQIS